MTENEISNLEHRLDKIERKVDQSNEQITLLRIDQAMQKHVVKNHAKIWSTLFGIIGGAVSAALATFLGMHK